MEFINTTSLERERERECTPTSVHTCMRLGHYLELSGCSNFQMCFPVMNSLIHLIVNGNTTCIITPLPLLSILQLPIKQTSSQLNTTHTHTQYNCTSFNLMRSFLSEWLCVYNFLFVFSNSATLACTCRAVSTDFSISFFSFSNRLSLARWARLASLIS